MIINFNPTLSKFDTALNVNVMNSPLVCWLMENVGPIELFKSNLYISGDGWGIYRSAEVCYDPAKICVKFDDILEHGKLVDFCLRFT